MEKKALIYTRDKCAWCERAKGLLALQGADYDRRHVGPDAESGTVGLTPEKFKAEIFDKTSQHVTTLPQIFLPTETGMLYIGGFDQLEAHYNKADVSTDDFSDFSL
jgi:glutaredoxin